jgi:hypothetical protein
MEAIMPSSITQWVVGMAVALGLAAAGVSVIGSAVARSPIEQTQIIAQEPLVNRHASEVSETDFRLGDHQQLRRLFLGN